ncbi:MAG: N-acetylmuramic acid 6-phosphate etherase [Caldilineaceae bacterium]|nr:N-acetylmuramic acid 6-phosphate etherase [Caldilineaceae bacterium]
MSLPPTEQRNPASTDLDSLSTLAMVRLMNRQDATIPAVIAEVLPQIAQAVDQIAATLDAGGRLFYQGAGTSGRLAVLDAVELIPTFRVLPTQVIGLIAGGNGAMMRAVEGAEDDREQGARDLEQHQFQASDLLVGVAASGRTPYVLGGLAYANQLGAPTMAVVCNPASPMAAAAALAIEIVTGPEVLTGSTRLRAGTATKLVLNMLSTCAMVKLGKVYGNWMVDVQPTNLKLRQRAIRIVTEITGADAAVAASWLQAANWQVKTAVVMGLAAVDAPEAQERLSDSRGRVREALHPR